MKEKLTQLSRLKHLKRPKLKRLELKKPNKITCAIIKGFLIRHKEVLLQCVFAIIIFLAGTYRYRESTMPILLNDEYGYWSNSAYFTGSDWSSVTSKIPYYSYGYSLVLAPVRLFSRWRGLCWAETYQLAQLVNVSFLVVGFFIAVQLCRRYMKNLNWVVRSMACFTVMVYGSNLFYAHITFTECTLNVVFWIFLYMMMRVIDRPSVANHIGYAVTAFYIYTVHQRSLAILATSVLVVLYLRIVRKNTLKQTAAFGVAYYGCSLLHSMIKGTLQNVCYMGNEPGGLAESLQYIFTKKSMLILVMCLVLFVLLFLLDKGKVRLVLCVITAGLAVAVVYVVTHAGELGAAQSDVPAKIAMNDFAGQWEKIQGIFSKSGLVRLGTSMVGKWFYLAASTGLVICWGMRNLFGNFFLMLADSAKRFVTAVKGREPAYTQEAGIQAVAADWNDRIWYTGVFLAWFGTFMICAIYKEGFYKNDDLVNGRYHEFVIGIILLYSLNILIKEKNWLITALVSLVMYVAAAWFCQFAMNELKRTEFELAHCVMFGRVIWNYQVPYGRIKVLSQYVLGLSAAFFAVFKLGSYFIKSNKVAAARCVLALFIPVYVWVHLADTIVDNYVVVRNEKQMGAMPVVAAWIESLGVDAPVYFAEDYLSARQAAVIQFMLQDREITMTHIYDMTFDEDAYYIINNRYLFEEPRVEENCKTVVSVGSYALVINKEQELSRRWEYYEEIMQ